MTVSAVQRDLLGAELHIREADAGDAAGLAEIYGHYVLKGTATFEEVPPDAAEMARRLQALRGRGYDWLVADHGGRIAGYAYLGPHKERSAYRYTAEDTVYVAPDQVGGGIGTRLLQTLLGRARQSRRFASVMAVIGDSANAGSIGLHANLGFRHVGTASGLGFKFGRFIDVVYMQLVLATGQGTTDPGTTDHGTTGHGIAGHGIAGHGIAGQEMAGQGTSEQAPAAGGQAPGPAGTAGKQDQTQGPDPQGRDKRPTTQE